MGWRSGLLKQADAKGLPACLSPQPDGQVADSGRRVHVEDQSSPENKLLLELNIVNLKYLHLNSDIFSE